MPRDENGFLKPEALVNGLKDQFAVEKDGVRHTVEVVHDRYTYGGYAVRHQKDGGAESQALYAWTYGTDLRSAQRQFVKIVRGLGGRA